MEILAEESEPDIHCPKGKKDSIRSNISTARNSIVIMGGEELAIRNLLAEKTELKTIIESLRSFIATKIMNPEAKVANEARYLAERADPVHHYKETDLLLRESQRLNTELISLQEEKVSQIETLQKELEQLKIENLKKATLMAELESENTELNHKIVAINKYCTDKDFVINQLMTTLEHPSKDWFGDIERDFVRKFLEEGEKLHISTLKVGSWISKQEQDVPSNLHSIISLQAPVIKSSREINTDSVSIHSSFGANTPPVRKLKTIPENDSASEQNSIKHDGQFHNKDFDQSENYKGQEILLPEVDLEITLIKKLSDLQDEIVEHRTVQAQLWKNINSLMDQVSDLENENLLLKKKVEYSDVDESFASPSTTAVNPSSPANQGEECKTEQEIDDLKAQEKISADQRIIEMQHNRILSLLPDPKYQLHDDKLLQNATESLDTAMTAMILDSSLSGHPLLNATLASFTKYKETTDALWRKIKSTQSQLTSLRAHNEDLKKLIIGAGFGKAQIIEWEHLKREVIDLSEKLESLGVPYK